jgi:hypothetical protein
MRTRRSKCILNFILATELDTRTLIAERWDLHTQTRVTRVCMGAQDLVGFTRAFLIQKGVNVVVARQFVVLVPVCRVGKIFLGVSVSKAFGNANATQGGNVTFDAVMMVATA